MSATDDLLQNNRNYAAGFSAAEAPGKPAKKVAIVACMDARLDPARALGLNEGDAHVIRNAGGLATDDAVRSLAISQHLLGTEEIIVIQHTKCGMTSFSDEEFSKQLEDHAGEQPPFSPGAFANVEDSLRATVKELEGNPFLLNKASIRGVVYDVDTGELRELT